MSLLRKRNVMAIYMGFLFVGEDLNKPICSLQMIVYSLQMIVYSSAGQLWKNVERY